MVYHAWLCYSRLLPYRQRDAQLTSTPDLTHSLIVRLQIAGLAVQTRSLISLLKQGENRLIRVTSFGNGSLIKHVVMYSLVILLHSKAVGESNPGVIACKSDHCLHLDNCVRC